jgi:hypothetical protein
MPAEQNLEQNCLNCYFFLQTSERANQKIGYCRANPPQYHEEIDLETGISIPKIGRFPVVLNNMWCGMWDYHDGK